MKDVILRNARAEQYLCAARKNFILKSNPVSLSESHSKILIGHFTDLHSDVKRFENAMELFEYHKPVFAIHTGDVVTWNFEDDYSFFYEGIRNSSVPVYNCIGNHETGDNKGAVTNGRLDQELIQPLKGICNEHRSGYYYVDFEKEKIRLIALNNYDADDIKEYMISQTQCDWLIKTLKGASEKEYGVIIASHEADEQVPAGSNDAGFCQRYAPAPWGYAKPSPTVVSDIVDAFRNGKTLKETYTWWYAGGGKVEIDCSFDKKSEFICYLSGHRHGDYTGYLPSHPDQLSMVMTCSGCFPEGYHNIGEECSDLPRIPDTISEDAVNFYVIDRTKKTIAVVRFGAAVNDLFEERLYAVYQYDRTER